MNDPSIQIEIKRNAIKLAGGARTSDPVSIVFTKSSSVNYSSSFIYKKICHRSIQFRNLISENELFIANNKEQAVPFLIALSDACIQVAKEIIEEQKKRGISND
jgi:hypothetical protein